jgi:hypothetical protein
VRSQCSQEMSGTFKTVVAMDSFKDLSFQWLFRLE